MPEESHFLFKRAAGEEHPCGPPVLGGEAIRDSALDQLRPGERIVHGLVVDALVVDQIIDSAFAPSRHKIVDFIRGTTESQASQQVRSFIVGQTCHEALSFWDTCNSVVIRPAP